MAHKADKQVYVSNKVEEDRNDSKYYDPILNVFLQQKEEKNKSNIIINMDGELCFNNTTIVNYIKKFYNR